MEYILYADSSMLKNKERNKSIKNIYILFVLMKKIHFFHLESLNYNSFDIFVVTIFFFFNTTLDLIKTGSGSYLKQEIIK